MRLYTAKIEQELNSKTIFVIKKSIKNHAKLKSFDDVDSAMKYLLFEKKTIKPKTYEGDSKEF